MNEQVRPNAELTHGAVSHTLDAGSTMSEPPREESPQSKSPRPEGSHHANNSDVDRIWKERAQQSMTQGEAEARRILEELMGSKTGVSEGASPEGREFILGQAGSGMVDKPGYRYDAYNQAGGVGNGNHDTEDANEGIRGETPESPRGNDLGHIDVPSGLDSELSSVARLINREIGRTIRKGDEDSLETLRALRQRFNERLVKLPDQDTPLAYGVLNQLDEVENALRKSIIEAGRGSPRERDQHNLWVRAEQFDQDFGDVMRALREGRHVEPQIEEEFRRVRQALVNEIIEQVEAEETPSLEAGRFPPALMNAALKFKETRELLLNEIIFKPYEDITEQGHYEINFYASGTLDELLAAMSKLAKRGFDEDRDIYQKYKGIKTTARNFWEMNRGLWTGNLENFSRIAEEMNYEQFDLMKDLPGVGGVMRLYDQKLYEELGRSGRITSVGFDRVKKDVEKSFRALNAAGVLKSEYYNDRDGTEAEKKNFHEWEVSRALSVGRVYYNITFRSSEVIAMSQINVGGGGKAYTSFPFENAARIMNPILTAERFGMGTELGGMELWQNAVNANKEIMVEDRRHLGINRFTHINGAKVEDMEFMANNGISGVFSGWRMFYAAYPNYKFEIEESAGSGKVKSVRDLEYIMDHAKLKYRGETKEGYLDLLKAISNDKKLSVGQRQDEIVRRLGFLIGSNGKMETGLGVFLRLMQGNAGTGPLGGEVGFKARQQIWKRIAETNPLAVINILTGLQEPDGKDKSNKPKYKESVRSLKNILLRQGIISVEQAAIEDPNDDGYYLNNPDWVAFKEKLQMELELKTKAQTDPSFANFEKPVLLPKEKALLEAIKSTLTSPDAAGKAMTADMADIVFPFMTFMNDVSYENLIWKNVGAQFFKRRFGDIGQYNSAVSKGIFPLLDNIGGMKPEDVVGAYKELVNGIKGPNGEESAWGAVLPWELGYLQMGMTYSGPDSWAPIKDAKAMLKKETSRLQHYAGPEALSMSKEQAYNFLHSMRHAGVISHHTEELIRKKRRITLADLIWAFLLDVVPMLGLSMVAGTVKSTVSLQAA